MPMGPIQWIYQPAGATDSTWRPSAIADDSAGHVYVLNTSPKVHAVQQIGADGTLTTVGVLPASVSQGGFLPGFAVTRSGTVYVPYPYSDKLQVIARGQATRQLSLTVGWPFAADDRGNIDYAGGLDHLEVAAAGGGIRSLGGTPLQPRCAAPY